MRSHLSVESVLVHAQISGGVTDAYQPRRGARSDRRGGPLLVLGTPRTTSSLIYRASRRILVFNKPVRTVNSLFPNRGLHGVSMTPNVCGMLTLLVVDFE